MGMKALPAASQTPQVLRSGLQTTGRPVAQDGTAGCSGAPAGGWTGEITHDGVDGKGTRSCGIGPPCPGGGK
jgi:hypothetical protein